MTDLLHQLALPVVLDGAEHAHSAAAAAHADAAGVGALGGAWPMIAAAVLLGAGIGGVAWALWHRAFRAQLPAPRWAAAALVAALLTALPLLSLHATHHLDGDPDGHCALAGIAHSVAGGVLASTPSLSLPAGALLPPPPYLRRDADRATPQPIARGPPPIAVAI